MAGHVKKRAGAAPKPKRVGFAGEEGQIEYGERIARSPLGQAKGTRFGPPAQPVSRPKAMVRRVGDIPKAPSAKMPMMPSKPRVYEDEKNRLGGAVANRRGSNKRPKAL